MQPTAPNRGKWIRAFSLIELLVVMGIIVMLGSGAGLALRGSGTRGAALQSAQAQCATLLSAVRAQAILHQTSARLLIQASPPPLGETDRYLRCLQIAREEPAESGQWVAGSEPLYLPRGIFVVPSLVPTSHLATGVTWPVGPFAPVSTLPRAETFVLNGTAFGDAYYVGYRSDGRPDVGVTKLVIGTAQSSRDSFPRFDDPAAVRGVRLRPSGAILPINNSTGF